ncbi:ScbA/BarX family gamma-butyrolactone biosynthesis protein [Streptomyces roseochromogenus]|uniref:ScbA/BarX family gamma-butyrolactone biosynthesis protein n=1 Tax=Streptomyces roseochromogenus TaxID=285450 RepID=UPI001319EDBD|nr:ScbA/BarX family gamma-butyrolactone biosynthesis protein [Streptomyces roseochromogenus]
MHRRNGEQVLVTGVEQCEENRFNVSVHWPRDHRFYGPCADGGSDPQLVSETMRQAGILVGHVAYDVPKGHSFVMNELSHTVDWEALAPADTRTRLDLEVNCLEVRRRGRTLFGVRGTMVLRREGREVASGTFDYRCMSPGVYRRLRAEARSSEDPALPALPAPVEPVAVGRVRPQDVVIASSGLPGTFLLRAERDHPVLYDHPLDHVPGMAIIEAMRQTAQAVTGLSGAVTARMQTAFSHYVEHDLPCYLTTGTPTRPDGGAVEVPVQVWQRDQEAARGVIPLSPCGDGLELTFLPYPSEQRQPVLQLAGRAV